MAKYKFRNHHFYEDDGTTIKSTYQDILDQESTPNLAIPKMRQIGITKTTWPGLPREIPQTQRTN